MTNIIKVNNSSGIAKYKQIVQSVLNGIKDEQLRVGDQIPSLNVLVKELGLSQDTVLTAYNELKHRGIISSSIGKGYFIAKTDIDGRHNIFVLFDKMTPYKEVLYDAMKKRVGDKGTLDIYFHHGNQKVFNTLIRNAIGNYTAYMIVPIISPATDEILELIPKKRIFIVDQGIARYGKKYRSVCQNFEKDIIKGMNQCIDSLKKYKRFYFMHNDKRQQFKELEKGFVRFCENQNLPYSLITNDQSHEISKGDMYLLVEDKDLVSVIKECKNKHLIPGKDLGLISYNESPFKEIIADGITTITTDFEAMGYSAIDMVFKNKTEHLENPGKILFRNSL